MKIKNDPDYLHKIDLLKSELGYERVKTEEPLKYHLYNKISSIAELFYLALNQKDLILALNTASLLKIPYQVIGSGTKTVISSNKINGLVIKNKSSFIKISSFKGKVGAAGVGIDEANLEVDSGVTFGNFYNYLDQQGLKHVPISSPNYATLGGSIFVDNLFSQNVNILKVWEDGEIIEIPIDLLQVSNHIVLSLTVKVKAK